MLWLLIVCILFYAHEKQGYRATYYSPNFLLSIFLHLVGFVDDTKTMVSDFAYNTALPIDKLLAKLIHDAQL